MSHLSKDSATLRPAAKVQNWTRVLLSVILILGFTPGKSANPKRKQMLKQSQAQRKTQKKLRSKISGRKRKRKAQRKFTLRDAGNDYEIELRRLVSNINKIRTKAEYIEAMAPGVTAKERAKIRQRLQAMKSPPRAHYKGNKSFLLINGKKRFLIRLKDFSKAQFTINGVPWTYNPKRSYIQQLDAFSKVMSKTQKSASRFPFSAIVPEAQAEPVTTVVVAGLVVVAAGTQAVRVYRKYKKYQKFYREQGPAQAAAATTRGGRGRQGGGRQDARDRAARAAGQPTREERKAAEQAAAKQRKWEAALEDARMDAWVQKQLAKENPRNLQIAGAGALAGITFTATTVGSQSVINAFALARERETTWYRELLCPYISESHKICQKMQVKIEPAVKTDGPAKGSRVFLPCRSKLLPEYISIKDATLQTADGKVQFQGKKINIIRWLDDESTVVEEHFAVPSKMDEVFETSGQSTASRGGRALVTPSATSSKSRFEEMMARQNSASTDSSVGESKKPIYLVQTKASRVYEFGPKGELIRIRELGFNRPTLPLESSAKEAPFAPSLVPNYDVPPDQQEAYFKSRREWLDKARDKSESENELINDFVKSQKNSILKEDWDGAVAEMNILKDSYNTNCGGKGSESSVKTIDVEAEDVIQEAGDDQPTVR